MHFILVSVCPFAIQDEYEVEHMIELGRSKKAQLDISPEGNDNAGFASTGEKTSINGVVASTKATMNGVSTNGGVAHRRSMPGVVTSSPEMIAFRPIVNGISQAPSTKTKAANAHSSDASALTHAALPRLPLDQQTATPGARSAVISSAEDAGKQINADLAVHSSAQSTTRDSCAKVDSDDPDKSPMTTSRDLELVDSPPSHSLHRPRRSGSSRREKRRRTRHSSSPDSRHRPSPPRCDVAGDKSATAFWTFSFTPNRDMRWTHSYSMVYMWNTSHTVTFHAHSSQLRSLLLFYFHGLSYSTGVFCTLRSFIYTFIFIFWMGGRPLVTAILVFARWVDVQLFHPSIPIRRTELCLSASSESGLLAGWNFTKLFLPPYFVDLSTIVPVLYSILQLQRPYKVRGVSAEWKYKTKLTNHSLGARCIKFAFDAVVYQKWR